MLRPRGWRVAKGRKWQDCICDDCRGGVPQSVKFFDREADAETERQQQERNPK